MTFRRFLDDCKEERLTEFYNILEQDKHLTCEEDRLVWKEKKYYNFKVKSAYKLLDPSTQAKELWPCKMICKGTIPQKVTKLKKKGTIPRKVACFIWLVARQAVLTQDNLNGKRVDSYAPDVFFRESEIETINHLFFALYSN